MKMSLVEIRLIVSAFLLVDISFHNALWGVNAVPLALYAKPLMNIATDTITNMVLQKLLRLENDDETAKCALSISNKLTKYRLINPVLYVEHGEIPMPVPLKIDTNSTVETIFEAVRNQKDTSGMLFYEIESTSQVLVIFWKVSGAVTFNFYKDNRYFVKLISTDKLVVEKTSLKEMYDKQKAYSDEVQEEPFGVKDYLLQVPGVNIPSSPTKNKLRVTIKAQMTTEKTSKLAVEISDNFQASPQQLEKRALTATVAGIGLITTLLNVVIKYITKWIPPQQTGTIVIENASNEIKLLNPSWYVQGAHTSSIAPWEIEPSKNGRFSYVTPLAGTKVTETFVNTVYFVSYQIEYTNFHVVIGAWFPWKISTGENTFTAFVMENTLPGAREIKDTLSLLAESLAKHKGNVDKLSSSLAENTATNYITKGIPGNKISGIVASKIGRYYEWQFPISTPKNGLKPGAQLYVKIVAACGYGKAFGMSVRVEVVPGVSGNAASFLAKNPQVYREPPQVPFVSLYRQNQAPVSPENTAMDETTKHVQQKALYSKFVPMGTALNAASLQLERPIKSQPSIKASLKRNADTAKRYYRKFHRLQRQGTTKT